MRRSYPSMLLYGFGLALVLSLGFNSYLLVEQSGRPGRVPDTLEQMEAEPTTLVAELQACGRDNMAKDSLIHQLQKLAPSPALASPSSLSSASSVPVPVQ